MLGVGAAAQHARPFLLRTLEAAEPAFPYQVLARPGFPVTMHDARTALAHFRLYERLVVEGSLQARLLNMYCWGKAHGWRA